MAFDPAKLAPKDLQCFLLDEIQKLLKGAPGPNAYTWLGRISGHPGDIISQLQHGNKTAQAESILDLCPDIYGLLVPYIKIYRVVYAPGTPFKIQAIQELPFKNFVPEEDIDAMLKGGYGRTSGAGIKSFQWSLVGVNPAEVDNNITANLTMHFQSLYDLFRYNLGPSGYQGGIVGQPGYLDLIIQPRGQTAAGSSPGDPNPDRPCEEAHHQIYDGVDFRIKAVVGWSTPPGFDSLDIPGYSAAKLAELKTAIDATRIGLFLQVTRHEIDFNEDGSLTLSIDYQAALSGKLTSPIADIFAGETVWRARALNRDGSESAQRQSEIEALETEYQDVVEAEGAASNVGDEPAEKAATEEADELAKEIEKRKRHQRYIKYHSVLEPLYKDDKIYTIPIQAKELYEGKLNNPSLTAEERAQLAEDRRDRSLDITTPGAIDEDFLKKVAEMRSGDDESFDVDGSKVQWRHEDGEDIILINFFYLGDLIDSILSRLSHLGTDGNFQLLLGDVEVIDPLQAFQVESVNIACGDDSTAVKKLSEVNPLKHRGLNDITLRTNIADLPISLDLFRSWFKSTIIDQDISEYYLLHFICDICQDLISNSLSSVCYNNEFSYMINFATNTFDLSRSFQGALVELSDVAAAKGVADKNCTNQDPGSQPLSTLVMYSRDSTPKATGVAADDLAKGIYHYYMGASCGLVKSVNFTRHDQPHLREAKIQRYGALGAQQLRELYILNLRLVGNTLHKNGQYLYFNPTAIGAGDLVSKGTMPNLARMLGLGGYFMITDIEHKIEPETFEVLLKGYQEGITFEQEGVSSINYHDVEDPGPGNEDDSAGDDFDDAAGRETGETEEERPSTDNFTQLTEDVEEGAGVAD